MNKELSQEDFGTLCICAIRYCQGRRTYMPELVQGIVRNHINEISDKDITIMLCDCKLQQSIGLYGDEKIDKPGWLRWAEFLKEEADRRGIHV